MTLRELKCKKDSIFIDCGSLIYPKVCKDLDITFVVGVLGRCFNNPEMQHWKKAKHVMCYLKRTNGYLN